MKLYDYQKQAVLELLNGKKICTAGTGVGKTIIGLSWAKATGKPRVLVCTTASVRDAKGYEQEAEKWYLDWYQSLDEFTVISWAKLAEWTQADWDELDQYAIIYDEVDSVCAGISSLRGKAFLQIANRTDCWTGYTATPFESWIEAYPYFTATGYVKNKTQFKREFCVEMTYPFPKILGYKNEDTLLKWWYNISDKPDDSEVQRTLPPAVHKTVQFKPPHGYAKCERTSETLEGEFLDNSSAYRHYMRQLCCSKEKLAWLSDFIQHSDSPVLVLYNYNAELERIDATLAKAMRKGAKVWHINGAEHDIPTAETIGAHDVVLVQWRSGSRGLNLQFVNQWVSLTPYDGYKVSEQGRGRIRRVGQTKTQFYYYLICNDTLEETDIYPCLAQKGELASVAWAIKQKAKYNFKWKDMPNV